MEPVLAETMYPQLKDVEVKTSRRVLFDVQGQVFGISVDMLKQVPCVLASLSDESRFKNKEPDGTVFINRSPKHFAEILSIIANFQSCDLWNIPESAQDRNELLQEADFYSLPPEIMEILKGKVVEQEDAAKKRVDDLQAQITKLQRELDLCNENLTKEIQAKNELAGLNSDSSIQTNGCYVSISDISFSLRITRDFTRILWSGYRSLEKVKDTGYNYGKVVYEMRPLGALESPIVLWNTLKSYVLCERKSDNGASRIDLCSMGNGELLVYLEIASQRNSDPLGFHSPSLTISSSPPASSAASLPPSPSKSQLSMEERFAMASNFGRHAPPGFQRIVCRFQADPK
eukprot:Phypoly_transcript_03384.p1 GENE.Phypoly_transcript_03384~~Phypoly_transcript_03384.p1  ORF type:complete len:354 (+),score=63.23 Phypoly_transcript_03384:29-1063(+)